MKTYKSLDQLVLDLIRQYSTQKKDNASMSTQYSSDILPYSANKDVSSDETSAIVRDLVDSLNKLVQPYIDIGLEVVASNPPDDFINISSGAGVVSGHYVEVDESTKLRVPLDGITSTFYVNFDGNQIVVEPQRFDDKLALAKVVIPKPGTTVGIEDDQPEHPKENYNGWIVSGKDVLFDGKWTFDDDSLAVLGNKLNYILAHNIYGELQLNENLKISNVQGTLKADSKSLQLFYLSGNKASEFNQRGAFFYNTSGYELARFTATDARVGNIIIETNKIRSGNYFAGTSGFVINDNGTCEFQDVTVRGTIYANLGTIGGWSIDANKIYKVGTGSSGIIQGGTYRTSANVGMGADGVILDIAGLRGYSAELGQVFNLPTDGSSPSFSSGVINETIFNISTNSVMRTSDTVGDDTANSAGVLINNTGFYACEANQSLSDANVRILTDGSARFKGVIEATGGVIGGVTISGDTLVGGTIIGTSIQGGTLETIGYNQKIKIDNTGLSLLISGAGAAPLYGGGAKYGGLLGSGASYGTGQLAVINSPTLKVPFYMMSEQPVADFHFFNRNSDPTGAAELGDVAVVAGKLKRCSLAGTPGTWTELADGGSSAVKTIYFVLPEDPVDTGVDRLGRLYVDFNGTIQEAHGSLRDCPTGANMILDIRKNGTSIWNSTPANRLAISAGQHTGASALFDMSDVDMGDYFTFDVVQVGDTTTGAGSMLVVKLKVS